MVAAIQCLAYVVGLKGEQPVFLDADDLVLGEEIFDIELIAPDALCIYGCYLDGFGRQASQFFD